MKKKRLWLIFIPVLVLTAAAGWALFGTNHESFVDVRLGQVETIDLQQNVTVSGILDAGDTETIPVGSSRRISKVYIEEGMTVEAGQLLAELDTADLTLQRESFLLSLQGLEADLNEVAAPTLRADLANARSRVIQLDLNLANASRQLVEAEAKLLSDQSLFEVGALSLQALDTSRTTRDGLVNAVAQARQALTAAQADASDISAGKTLRQDTLERQLEQTRLNLERVDLQIQESRIFAGIEGDVADFPLDEGRFPPQGATIRIQDLTRWKVIVYLPQEDAVRITPDQTGEITIKGLSGTWPARVISIAREAAGEAGSGSRTPKVKVSLELDAQDSSFASGYDVEVSIGTGSAAGANVVPKEAVLKDASGMAAVLSVEVAQETASDGVVTGRLRRIEVTPGLETDTQVDIGTALSSGSYVVLPPVDEVSEGSLVKGTVIP